MRKLRFALGIAAVSLALSGLPAQAEFGGHIGSHLGFGSLGGGAQPVGNTSEGVLDLQLMPGYRFFNKQLMVGPLATLRFLSQLSGSADYGYETSGTGSLLGVAVAYEPRPVKVIVSYDLRARHSHSTPDTTYKGSGYTLLLGYLTTTDLFIDLELNRTSYNAREVLQVEAPLTTPLVHWNLGLGLSYSF